MLSRRRFLLISAAMAAVPGSGAAAPLHFETGIALGAKVTLRLSHRDGPALAALATVEISRQEDIFSCCRPDSALVRLNAAQLPESPPFELLDCLSPAAAVHRASDGSFDPTVQALWLAHAEVAGQGQGLTHAARAAALARTDWDGLAMAADRIALRPGMALALNGIAQGYIADRVAALLAAEGLTDSLIDTGEMVALGGRPGGGPWHVGLQNGGKVALRARALATSSPLGMPFGGDASTSPILDPRSGLPVTPGWQAVTISAPSAAIADAMSTAACLMKDEAEIAALCNRFPTARIETLL
jgi:thiamine biosynthesis lipoprotein